MSNTLAARRKISVSMGDRMLTLCFYLFITAFAVFALIPYPVLGFNFNTSDIDLSTAIAQCKAVTDLTATVKLHGIAVDGNSVSYDTVTDMLKANVESAMANGGQQVVDAMVSQLTEFLASQE